MGDVKTIVAALDLEPGRDAVLGRAIQLATEHAAQLVVVHASARRSCVPHLRPFGDGPWRTLWSAQRQAASALMRTPAEPE